LRGGDKVWQWRMLLRSIGAAIVLVAAAGAAAAHAVLLGSDPPHRAVLAEAPHHLVLRFNEPVTPIFVRLVDAAGRERALARPAHAVDRELHAQLPPGLEPGTYVATFRVTSADGHPVSGAILFAVGAAPGEWRAGTTTAGEGAGFRRAAIANRALHLVCLFAAAGGLLFAAFVRGRTGASARLASFAAAAAATGVVGVLLHGASLTGDLAAASAAYWQVALSTPQAASAAAALGGLFVAFAIAPRLSRGSGRASAVGGAAFALAATGVTGHSAAAGWVWWPVAAVHLMAAGFWFGSMPPLWLALRTSALPDAAALLQRFSRIAVPAVAVLAAAGAALALQRMHGLGDLAVTDYGRLVLAKIAGALLLIAIAARNRLRLTPAVARAAADAARRLRLAITAELTLMAGVIALAAVLAHTDPHAGHDHGHSHPDPGGAVLTLRLESGDRIAAVEIYPAKPGRNTLTVSFALRDGKPMAPLEASLELALPGAGIEGLSVKLSPLAPGKFAAEIAELALSGRWHLRIDALVSDFEKAIFRGEAEIR